jgi:alpha-amylase
VPRQASRADIYRILPPGKESMHLAGLFCPGRLRLKNPEQQGAFMSARKIHFAMGVHNHQPVGNFDYVLEEAYKKAYMPFLECLERHPHVRTALHFTGPLWDEYLKGKPEMMKKLRSLVKAGQVEMLSGAYYEPILVNIPDRDKIAQIKKMNRVVKRETGTKPRGMWCAERIWEPGLPRPIALSEIEYTLLDETHFRWAGMNEEDVFGYYVTEEQGHPLSIFPINYNLRQMIPYTEPEEIIAYLQKWADEEGSRLAVFADDGEKFGLWPSTFRITWESRWMDRFFDLLEKNSGWIEMVTFSQYMDKFRPRGRVYLPTASYFEMSAWALPTLPGRELRKVIDEVRDAGNFDRYGTFLRGGFWRSFLVKYPQANRIQKKALAVSDKVQRMIGRDKAQAEEELFRGQCNCPYWHGVFGGIYLPHLRHAVQECLIRAEGLADGEFHRGEPYKDLEILDIDRDLSNEVIINARNLQLSFAPHRGGVMYEMDYKPLCINLCDTLTRREETYHDQVPPGEMKEHLCFDRYERDSFIDHFFGDGADAKTLWDGTYEEQGDFVEKPYEIFTSAKDDKAVLTLSRKGRVRVAGADHPVEVEKTFLVSQDGSSVQVQYWLINNSDEDLELRFGSEMNFSFLSKEADTNHILAVWEDDGDEEDEGVARVEKIPLTQAGCQEDLPRLTLRDGHRGYQVTIDFGRNADAWHFPIETICQKLDGFERVYQSTAVTPVWKLKLEPGDTWDNTMEISVAEIPKAGEKETPAVQEEALA